MQTMEWIPIKAPVLSWIFMGKGELKYRWHKVKLTIILEKLSILEKKLLSLRGNFPSYLPPPSSIWSLALYGHMLCRQRLPVLQMSLFQWWYKVLQMPHWYDRVEGLSPLPTVPIYFPCHPQPEVVFMMLACTKPLSVPLKEETQAKSIISK